MTPYSTNNDKGEHAALHTSLGLQKRALISFYTGSDEEAQSGFDAVKRQMPTTRMMDPQSLLVMSITSYRSDRQADLNWCVTASRSLLSQAPASPHAHQAHRLIATLAACAGGKTPDVSAHINEVIADCSGPDFTLGVASNVVMVLSTIASKSGPLPGVEGAILQIGMRFCGVIAATEMLCRAAWVYPRYADIVRQAHGRVLKLAQTAIARSVAGNPSAAIDELVGHAERLGNAKLIESAQIALKRHHSSLANEAELIDRVFALSTQRGGKSHAQPMVGTFSSGKTTPQEPSRMDLLPPKVVK